MINTLHSSWRPVVHSFDERCFVLFSSYWPSPMPGPLSRLGRWGTWPLSWVWPPADWSSWSQWSLRSPEGGERPVAASAASYPATSALWRAASFISRQVDLSLSSRKGFRFNVTRSAWCGRDHLCRHSLEVSPRLGPRVCPKTLSGHEEVRSDLTIRWPALINQVPGPGPWGCGLWPREAWGQHLWTDASFQILKSDKLGSDQTIEGESMIHIWSRILIVDTGGLPFTTELQKQHKRRRIPRLQRWEHLQKVQHPEEGAISKYL